jgi:acylpyruvate hydrolase
MKLVTFEHNYEQNGQTRIGALQGQDRAGSIVDLQRADNTLPADMIELLNGGAPLMAAAAKAAAAAPATALVPRSAVTLKAPIPRPGKILCIGLNYRDHAAETNQALPDYPTIFAKYANTVIGPDAPIVLPRVSSQVDYEVELGVVIGRRAKYVSEGEALDFVAGYLPFQDVSARDYQRRTSQFTQGKSFDTFAPMGPALVTSDEIPDPHDLDIQLSIGGEVLQKSNTRHLIFNVNALVAYLSEVMTLEPGDVIATGTPSGVGAARKPPRFLRPGDVVRIEIALLGVLENPVVAEA